MKPPSNRQREILEYIQKFTEDNGYPPSLREIGRELGISSSNGVRYHMGKLEDLGLLERQQGKFRGIRVTSGGGFGRLLRVPILGRVAAGELTLAVQEREDTLAVDPDLFSSQGTDDLFALRVNGDSMIGAGIHDGDLAIVSSQSHVYNGDIVVAVLDDEATIKRFRRQRGQVHLIPENENYKPIIISKDDEGLRFRIAGKVVGIIRTGM